MESRFYDRSFAIPAHEVFISRLNKFLRLIEDHRFKLCSIDGSGHMSGTFHKDSHIMGYWS